MNKKVLYLILLSAAVAPAFASAVTIETMVKAAVNTALYIADGAIVILWVVTGLMFLSAQGAPDKLSSAKKAALYAVIGTALVIIANLGVRALVGGMFGIPAS